MPFGRRARVTILIGLALALVFVLLGLGELRRPAVAGERSDKAAVAPARLIPLAMAARAIRTGETISADMVKTAPGDPAGDASIASPSEVAGKVALAPIPAGAPIGRSALGSEDKLAIRVPIGMRAISINTTDEIAVAGLIRPGDRVDVQTVYPGADMSGGLGRGGRSKAVTLLQLVPVLAVGEAVIGMEAEPSATSSSTGLSPPPQRARTVTLALTPEQVSTLALAKSIGALYLALRNPADRALAVTSATGPAIESGPPLAAPVRPSGTRRAASKGGGHPIELVVGDRREIIYSGGSARP